MEWKLEQRKGGQYFRKKNHKTNFWTSFSRVSHLELTYVIKHKSSLFQREIEESKW